MTQFCHSKVLKRNIGEKWVKYIINKNIENNRRSFYHLQRSLIHRQQPPKHFVQYFFPYEICGFYHINIDIFELPLQAARLCLEPKMSFFSWVTLALFIYVVSSFLLLNFSSYFQKNLSSYRSAFLTYRENNFYRFFFMLLNVSLMRALKYQKLLIFFWELRSIKDR